MEHSMYKTYYICLWFVNISYEIIYDTVSNKEYLIDI